MVEKQLKSITFPGINESYFIPSIDKTLSLEDRAADAKAVGDALANKAPAGFGLGGTCVNIQDWNNVDANGFYYATTNSPDGNRWWGYAVANSSNYIEERAFRSSGGMMLEAHRTLYNGTWKPWEWVNPPMLPGIDYRTTERWNGNPVYVRFIDLGKIPKSTYKSVNWTSDENAQVISVRGVVGTNYNDFITVPTNNFNGAVGTFSLKGQRNLITIFTDYDYGDLNLYAELRYILIGG